MFDTRNAGLNGVMSPVTEEVVLNDLAIEGKVPDDLVGTLYRNSSNQRFKPLNADRYHVFDGDGMVYSIRLSDGKAAYRNKWVGTDGAKAELAAGRPLYNGLYSGSGVPQSALPPGAPPVKHTSSVNVIKLGHRTLALQETYDRWWELDPQTLEVAAAFDFLGATAGRGALTAHPHTDPVSGNLIFLQLDSRQREQLVIAEADASGKVVSKHSIHLDWVPYIHDLIFTRDYYVIMLGPIVWDTDFAPLARAGKSSWTFEPERGSKILLINRFSGAVQTFNDEPSQLNHYLNAYQEGDRIIVDGCLHPIVGGSTKTIVSEHFPMSADGKWQIVKPFALWRWTIKPLAGTVTHEHVNELAADLPRPNETKLGAKHRYGYFMSAGKVPGIDTAGAVAAKHDFVAGNTQYQLGSPEGGFNVGEPLFVPRKGATSEDDGYVLVVYRHEKTKKSQLLILDAQNFDGDPIARVHIPTWLPSSVHGNWVPAHA